MTTTPAWTIETLTDDEFEAMAAAGPRPERMVGRDALGRYCRMVNRHDVTVWITADDTSHSHARCGTLAKSMRRGAVATGSAAATGWLCTACVHVERTNVALASAHVPENHGTAVCDTCDTEKSIRKFPTVWVYGFINDRGTTCRVCRDAAITPRGSLQAA